jgi:uncharacterized protein with HEPN domain
MRNKLTHEYWDIDLNIVWITATKDAQKLKKQLLELIDNIGK